MTDGAQRPPSRRHRWVSAARGLPWRRAGRVLIVVVVATSFVWGGVRLADPVASAPSAGPEPVDDSAPPARIAYQAMTQPTTASHEVTAFVGNTSSLTRAYKLRVEPGDRQVRGRFVFHTGRLDREVYGSDAGAWQRYAENGTSVTAWGWDATGTSVVWHDRFYRPSAVLETDADVAVVERDEETLVVRIEDTDTAVLLARDLANYTAQNPDVEANLTLGIDRQHGVLEWSRFRRSDGSGFTSVTVQRFDRWGEVEVRRPRGLPQSFTTVLWDLQNRRCPACGEER